jgi:hypothetical protein
VWLRLKLRFCFPLLFFLFHDGAQIFLQFHCLSHFLASQQRQNCHQNRHQA